MKNLYCFKLLLPLILLFIGQILQGQTLVHYWNFNDNSSYESITSPNISLVTGSSLNSVAGGESVINFSGGTGQNFDVENLNARNGDPAGTHLRFNNPIGGALVFVLPTTGYENVVVKFATRRSGSGAGTQNWYYSIDGNTFTLFGQVIPNDGNPELATLDFTTIPTASNNANFKLKVEFEQGNGGTVGNNRFDNFTLDATEIGGVDITPPTVIYNPENGSNNISTSVHPQILFNENIRLIDDSEVTEANAASLVTLKENDENGLEIPFTTDITANSITIIPTQALQVNQTYYFAVLANLVEDFNDNVVTHPGFSTFTTESTSVTLDQTFIRVNEDVGSFDFIIHVNSPSDSSIDLVVKPAPFSTADANDFAFETQTIQITADTPEILTFNIPIIDDNLVEQHAEYFVISLENPINLSINGDSFTSIYIVDNDNIAPVPTSQIQLEYIGSFDPSGDNNSTTEIVAHDPISQRLFTTSSITNVLDIIDFSNPTSLSVIQSISMDSYGGLTSVAVKNQIVAVASPNANPQENGSVVFFDTDGNFLNQVSVGALPDMIIFTPDGTKVLTANEGEPNSDYSIDPEGSVSIIDISGGIANLTQSHVNTLYFTNFNAQEASLIQAGVRKLKASSSLSQDLEPEYIAVSGDSSKAWITLQENNAIAELDLVSQNISSIWPLGKKDMSLPGNGFDASDRNGEIVIANWPVKSYYIPDAVASYSVNGVNYIVTANEGDEKEFDTLNERTTVGANSYVLNPEIFPNAEMLKDQNNLGRFRVTNLNGNFDQNPDFEEINSLGARSFSIFNADTGQLVFDSGDQFERYTAEHWAAVFNSDHEENEPKGRSRSKGPEPEGVTIAEIEGETFAFISLERIGGVMVYNITNPAQAEFVDYKNTRMTTTYGGDNGAEGILYIPATDSTADKGYIVVANEISGTLTIYEINIENLSTSEVPVNRTSTFSIFPNPAKDIVYFNRAVDYQLFDFSGKKLIEGNNSTEIKLNNLKSGMYFIRTSEGISKKLLIK